MQQLGGLRKEGEMSGCESDHLAGVVIQHLLLRDGVDVSVVFAENVRAFFDCVAGVPPKDSFIEGLDRL